MVITCPPRYEHSTKEAQMSRDRHKDLRVTKMRQFCDWSPDRHVCGIFATVSDRAHGSESTKPHGSRQRRPWASPRNNRFDHCDWMQRTSPACGLGVRPIPRMSLRALAILALIIGAPCAVAQNISGSALQRIDRHDLCVTNGAVSMLPGGRLAIDMPSSRAVVRAAAKSTADQVAEIRFRYLGPTPNIKPLASGG